MTKILHACPAGRNSRNHPKQEIDPGEQAHSDEGRGVLLAVFLRGLTPLQQWIAQDTATMISRGKQKKEGPKTENTVFLMEELALASRRRLMHESFPLVAAK